MKKVHVSEDPYVVVGGGGRGGGEEVGGLEATPGAWKPFLEVRVEVYYESSVYRYLNTDIHNFCH
jgi:hypothetical protein